MTDLCTVGDAYLDSYQGPRPLRGRHVTARRSGRCVICGGRIEPGELYVWSDDHGRGAHLGCGTLTERKVKA